MNAVRHCSALELLGSLECGSVDAIVTCPPYSGLPGRGDTLALVEDMLGAAATVLNRDHGTITLVVGSAGAHVLTPFAVAELAGEATRDRLEVTQTYVVDRTGTLNRACGEQNITHDHVIHLEHANVRDGAIARTSVLRPEQPTFNYGLGVTTPPDLASLIVSRVSEPGQLVVDPFAGLAEIGVQAIAQRRQFLGADTNAAVATIATHRLADALERRA